MHTSTQLIQNPAFRVDLAISSTTSGLLDQLSSSNFRYHEGNTMASLGLAWNQIKMNLLFRFKRINSKWVAISRWLQSRNAESAPGRLCFSGPPKHWCVLVNATFKRHAKNNFKWVEMMQVNKTICFRTCSGFFWLAEEHWCLWYMQYAKYRSAFEMLQAPSMMFNHSKKSKY